MTRNATTRVTSWLEQFQKQYLAWKAREDVRSKARDYEVADAASGPFGSPFDVLGWALGMGAADDMFFDMAMQDIPLHLMFTG